MSISRNTKTVKLLLELFDKENNALSVVDLVSILSQEMNKTTVYRILQRLEGQVFYILSLIKMV